MAVYNRGFAKAIKKFEIETKTKLTKIFQTSAQLTIEDMQRMTPRRTGYAADTVTVQLNSAAKINPAAGGYDKMAYAAPTPSAVIANAKLGDTITGCFIAAYAPRLEYGFTGVDSKGRAVNSPPNGMVRMAAQRFPTHVRNAVKRHK